MKKFILTASLVIFVAMIAFCQKEEKNGTTYIKHPYIDVVMKTMDNYRQNKNSMSNMYYADTAKFWESGMDKPISMMDASKALDQHFMDFDNIMVKQVGYPDYLHYIDQDSKIVQSWWTWSGKSKKTGEVVNIDFVMFNMFNKAGKIVFESLYGNFPKDQ